MSHVMVPVPEEHLAEFQYGLMRLTLGMAGWDDNSLQTLLDDLGGHDELSVSGRQLVKLVAEVAADSDRIPYTSAARALDLAVGDVLQLVTQVNDRCLRAGIPMPLITDTATAVEADGSPVAIPVLTMVTPVAKKVLDLWPPTEAAITAP